jgi:hypothetical protein
MKMIKLLDNGTEVGWFETWQELHEHITTVEDSLLPTHSKFANDLWNFGICSTNQITEQPKAPWSFKIYSPKQVARRLQDKKKPLYNIPVMMEAVHTRLSLLEVCKGDSKDITSIILTADIDVDLLLQNWCKMYADANDFTVVEE